MKSLGSPEPAYSEHAFSARTVRFSAFLKNLRRRFASLSGFVVVWAYAVHTSVQSFLYAVSILAQAFAEASVLARAAVKSNEAKN